MVAAFFPCDFGCRPSNPSFSQIVHHAAGLAGYLFAPPALAALAVAARVWPRGRNLSVLAWVAAAASLAGMLTLSPTSPFVGLSQRILEVAVLGWAVACGAYVRASHRTSL